MPKLTIPPLNMRVPFYCGVVAFAWPYLFYVVLNIAKIWAPLEVSVFIFPFMLLLLVPAIQLHSWRLAFRALWLGPLLVIVHSLLGFLFTIDNRIISALPFLVPGGLDQMNPGGFIWNLIPQLALFIALTTYALRRAYGTTQIINYSYTDRVMSGGFVLAMILCVDIWLTTVYWEEVNTVSDAQLRCNWVLASVSWLISSGAYWSFVFGVPLEREKNPVLVS